ncbi:glycine-rich protein-like [Solanum dulcamara]|uniref:glycine-rich protein-like n=1 Tax=Solanum dulcamara TaxID=45834 RepID=UPI0024868A7A|nr:glycine-rich protein-like [Solanum dulcamara]
MGLKVFMLLSLALAILVILTSEVAARELAESSTNTVEITKKSEKENEINDAKYPGGGYPGGGYGGYPGGGYGGYPGRWYGGYPGRWYGGGYPGGGYCRYGCCRRNYYGDGCYRCC